MPHGTKWGHTYEYCWMRSRITPARRAAGKRVLMNLTTGGETTVFVDGRSFGTYRADWVSTPHHFMVDNFLTPCGEAGRTYDLLLEAYAGHFWPQSPLGWLCDRSRAPRAPIRTRRSRASARRWAT